MCNRNLAVSRACSAFIGKDTPNDLTTAASDSAGIDAFGKKVGAPPRVVTLYQAWGRGNEKIYFNFEGDNGVWIMDEVVSQGAMSMVTWTPR